MLKPLLTCPPPPNFESRAPPTTVTMRAITDDDGEVDDAAALPSEPFEVLFDRAVDAYLAKDHSAALDLFRDALRLQPTHEVCLHNVRRIEARIAQDGQA